MTTYTVTFKDYDGNVLATLRVAAGLSAIPPPYPTKKEIVFNGWDNDYTNVASDVVCNAVPYKFSIHSYDIACLCLLGPNAPVDISKWNVGIEKCIKYSIEHDVPCMVFWGLIHCGNCSAFEQEFRGRELYGYDLIELGDNVDDTYFFKLLKELNLFGKVVLCISNEEFDYGYSLYDGRDHDVTVKWLAFGYNSIKSSKSSFADLLDGDQPFAFSGSNRALPLFAFYWKILQIDSHKTTYDMHNGSISNSVILFLNELFKQKIEEKQLIESKQYKVVFYDYDNTILKSIQYVKQGTDAIPPETPVRENFRFTNWQPDYHNVLSDITCIALYMKETKQYENPRYVSNVNKNTTLFAYNTYANSTVDYTSTIAASSNNTLQKARFLVIRRT